MAKSKEARRPLDVATLDAAARYYAARFMANVGAENADWVVQQFYNFTFKDEFEHLLVATKKWLGPAAGEDFNRLGKQVFEPRSDALFEDLLAEKLAIDVAGNHLDGVIATTQIGSRLVGSHAIEVESPESVKRRKRFQLPKSKRETMTKQVPLYWPIYAGEGEERVAGSGVADPLPPGAPGLPVGALNTRISNEVAILMVDAAVDNLDEGTGAAVIQGRTGAQPADPDTAVTGTLLFTLVASDPAFGAGADAAPGGQATANAVTDDSSADATGTVGYCRVSATNDGATPLDDHIDGEAGTSGADFNFNTVSIVSGATVSLTSWTVTQPES